MNRLQHASSPYLRQHADNPVDWHEWGEEAFAKARAEDKPIFLSVGYSSCHWCHVMAHESFEDGEVAQVLNEHFVSVKVDREERPDVDAVYMGAVQALNQGRGGWPMSVFITPDGQPFFAGTYYPKEDRHGMPGFVRVLGAVATAWENERDKVLESSQEVTRYLDSMQAIDPAVEAVDVSLADQAAKTAVQVWDSQHGGFGQAPKFPQSLTIDFLLAHWLRTQDRGALEAAVHSLERMSRGGIYDHVGGGFARYSVDEIWLVPHFEKMLYDNALLLRAYTHAAQVTGNARFRRVALETADYLLREMRHPSGGFYSATDADSEGIEGKFFVWSKSEFSEVVAAAGEDPDEWAAFFGVTDGGTFTDPHHPEWGSHNILHEAGPRPDEARLDKVRAALYERRSQRVSPGLDDKVLASWNALVIGALAEAGAALGEPRYIEAAAAAARFLRDELVVDGRLHHTWKEGHGPRIPAFLEDVAYLAQALLVLYEADHDPAWFTWARELAAHAEEQFADPASGSYFTTAHDAEPLVTRPRDVADGATPAGSSVMTDVHLRLGALTGEPEHDQRAEQLIGLLQGAATRAPTGYGELLRAMERLAAGPLELAVAGAPSDPRAASLVTVYREQWRPGAVLAVAEPAEQHPVPLMHERRLIDGRPAAYVCRSFACERPVTEAEDLRTLLSP